MSRRRKTVAAAAVASIVFLLVLVGLGAHRHRRAPDAAHREVCAKDIGQVFDGCGENNYCAGVPAEFADACQAGCVKGLCPEQVTCTALDPISCAPCDDMHGAPFWENREAAAAYCSDELHGKYSMGGLACLRRGRRRAAVPRAGRHGLGSKGRCRDPAAYHRGYSVPTASAFRFRSRLRSPRTLRRSRPCLLPPH